MKNTEYEQIALDTMQAAADSYTQSILNEIAYAESLLPCPADEITVAGPFTRAVLYKIAKLEALLLQPTA